MRFTKPWEAFAMPDGSVIWRPTLRVLLWEADSLGPHHFLVDSGADISMASRDLCDSLGKEWEDGERRLLYGISRKKVCQIESRILRVDIVVAELGIQVTIPMCFAEGHAPLLLGREGFFEYFRITFDRQALLTTFEFMGKLMGCKT
ncbi:MAG: hypothetical protein ISS49_08260 [Anaerolineae bacterium]|nr:hypothetical protein [Anaerolineae bacterium]